MGYLGNATKMVKMELPNKKYQIVYADPPWRVDMLRNGKDKGRRFDHYETMKTEDICKLPINRIKQKNCVLFLWATNTFLSDAFKVMTEWGFKYHCTISVEQTKRNNDERIQQSHRISIVWIFRSIP